MPDRGRLLKAIHAIDEQIVFLVALFEKEFQAKNALINEQSQGTLSWLFCLNHYDFITRLTHSIYLTTYLEEVHRPYL